jgi:hypothetical protein
MPEELRDQRLTSLEDKAWQDMENRLDMVLPVKRGLTVRERWLLALLLLLLIFTGGYIGYNELFRDQGLPVEINNGQEYAAALPHQLPDGTVSGTTSSPVGSNEMAGLQKRGLNPVQNDKQLALGNLVNNTREEFKNHQIEPLSKIDFSLNYNKYSLFNWLDMNALPVVPVYRNMESLPNKVGGINYGLADFPIRQNPVPVSRDYNNLCLHTIGLNAGLVSENITSYGGYEFGLNYYKVLNRKFALRTGLDFQMFSKNGFINSLALASFDDLRSLASSDDETWAEARYTYDVKNSEIINDEVGAEYIVGIVDQLYYLTIPLNLMYEFGHSRIYGGLNASLLLKGTNKVFGQDDLYFNTMVLSNSVLERRNYFNRLDLGLELGVETKLWGNLYVYSKFNYGMFEIVNAESARETNASFKDNFETLYNNPPADRIDFNRYFTVGLKYLINSCD